MAEHVSHIYLLLICTRVRKGAIISHTSTLPSFHPSQIASGRVLKPPALNSDHDESLSPTQTNGPKTLSIEDIQAYLVGKETELRPKRWYSHACSSLCAYFLLSYSQSNPLVVVMYTEDSSSTAVEENELWQYDGVLSGSINNTVLLTSLSLTRSNESSVEPRVAVSFNDCTVKFPMLTCGTPRASVVLQSGLLDAPVNHCVSSPIPSRNYGPRGPSHVVLSTASISPQSCYIYARRLHSIKLCRLRHRHRYIGTEMLGSRRPFKSHLSCQDCGERVGGIP